MNYEEFLSRKKLSETPIGLCGDFMLNENLFDFQKDIVKWALKKGRCAIFADCGMGKTLMQLSWALNIPGKVLIVAPLAVSEQTIREGLKFGIDCITYSENGKAKNKITITNYERLEKFNPKDYKGIILDESSIIKSFTGTYRNLLIENWTDVPYRLACTATPAPNDYMELGNHSEFLGIMKRTEMLSMFFVHDGGETSKWRLKGHAKKEFWKWVCDWAVLIRKPSDLGYEDGKFILPKLNIISSVVQNEEKINSDTLFDMRAETLQERQVARRNSTEIRVEEVARIVSKKPDEQWLIWCDMNIESETLHKMIPNSVEVKGSDTDEHKKKSLLDFSSGKLNVLITKPKIAGMGMNFQSCHNVVFTGLSDSYEQFYQAIRRCWRFGQNSDVDCYVVTSDLEGAVVENIKRKEKDSENMINEMLKNMKDINKNNIRGTYRNTTNYIPSVEMKLPKF